MTLIEVMLHYHWVFKKEGREAADQFLHDACDESLWEHVHYSFNEEGEFITADDNVLRLEPPVKLTLSREEIATAVAATLTNEPHLVGTAIPLDVTTTIVMRRFTAVPELYDAWYAKVRDYLATEFKIVLNQE